MKKFTLTILALLTVFINDDASAQSYSLPFRGISLNCTANNGQSVYILTSPQAARIASRHGGGYAIMHRQYGPLMLLDLRVLNSIPAQSALMIFYHECAHLALPYGVGLGSPAQERNADCYAIRAMRNHRAITNWQDFYWAIFYAASMRHSPSDDRIDSMARCIAWP